MATIERLRKECEGDRNLHIYKLEQAVKQVQAERDRAVTDGAAYKDALDKLIDFCDQAGEGHYPQVREARSAWARISPSSRLLDLREIVAGLPKVDGMELVWSNEWEAWTLDGVTPDSGKIVADALARLLAWRGKD